METTNFLGNFKKILNEKKVLRRLMIVLLILVAVSVLVFITTFICFKLVETDTDDSITYYEYDQNLEKRDYIIVAGSNTQAGKAGSEMRDRLDRVIQMKEDSLYEHIILSGNHVQVHAMKNYLRKKDFPIDKVIIDNSSYNTYDTLKRAYSYAPNSTFYISSQIRYGSTIKYITDSIGMDCKIINTDLIIYQTTRKNYIKNYFSCTKTVFKCLFSIEPKEGDIKKFPMEVFNE